MNSKDYIDYALDQLERFGESATKFMIVESYKKAEHKKRFLRSVNKWIKEIESRRFESLDDPKIQLHKVFKQVLQEIK